MSRSGVRVRPAVAADLPGLLALAEEVREPGLLPRRSGPRAASGGGPHELRQRFNEVLADPGRRLVLAVGEDDEILGLTLLSQGSASLLWESPAVEMSHTVVADRHRRRGAGRALVGAAATYAEETGADQVVVGVVPGARDANRFFARLGFAPLVVRRVAPLAMLRRRLGLNDGRPVLGPSTGPLAVTELVSRRRTLRPLSRGRAPTAVRTRPEAAD